MKCVLMRHGRQRVFLTCCHRLDADTLGHAAGVFPLWPRCRLHFVGVFDFRSVLHGWHMEQCQQQTFAFPPLQSQQHVIQVAANHELFQLGVIWVARTPKWRCIAATCRAYGSSSAGLTSSAAKRKSLASFVSKKMKWVWSSGKGHYALSAHESACSMIRAQVCHLHKQRMPPRQP